MKKVAYVLVIILTITGLMLLCPPAATSKATWEQKWESTLAKAKKEGIVRVYTVWGPKVTNPLKKAFKEKYGFELEFTHVGRGSAIGPKLAMEKSAGLRIADALGCGTISLTSSIKPKGFLGPIEPLLILPEVTDPKVWAEGQLPFLDKDRLVIGMIASIQRNILYNKNLIKKGEITRYKDLLKPQYKGKICMSDPGRIGPLSVMFGHLARNLWNEEEASQFLRRLLRDQKVVMLEQERLVTEWVSRGKYPIGLGGHPPSIVEFTKAGAPIDLVVQKEEGHVVDPAGGGLAVPTDPNNPNGAAVFVNFLLSKEGQTLFAVEGYGYPSVRVDVPTEGVLPIYVPRPDEKYFFAKEDFMMFTRKMQKVSKRIIQEEAR